MRAWYSFLAFVTISGPAIWLSWYIWFRTGEYQGHHCYLSMYAGMLGILAGGIVAQALLP